MWKRDCYIYIKHTYVEENRMNKNILLLTDEIEIGEEDYIERCLIVEKLKEMPMQLFEKMRHFQPQVGCLNCCSICSKIAGTTMAFWNERRIRNVVAGIKAVVYIKYRNEKPYIVWNREEHRSGVIFSYLDNDIGNYYYLDKFIEIVYKELGVKTRISTVGFSRYNKRVRDVHININSSNLLNYLAGVRLSFTPYAIGWANGCSSSYFSRNEYIQDMAEFLKIYKPYYDKVGAGSRKMCVELRYKPLAINKMVIVKRYKEHLVIATGTYLYISCEENIILLESRILDAYEHTIRLTQEPKLFYEINLVNDIYSETDLDNIMETYDEWDKDTIVDLYMLKNKEGEYYSINPSISEKGNYGINIYPKTDRRKQSGYLITERFFLNVLYEYKRSLGLSSMQMFDDATWDDVDKIMELCNKSVESYRERNKIEKAEYIKNEIIPMLDAYIRSLKMAEYLPTDFFNPNFTIDTGIICNLGRAMKEFNGLTQKMNEPLTPTHERNYGHHNSTMTKEGIAWRLSCNYNDELLIEKLNLRYTDSEEGQVVEQFIIKLGVMDEKKDISHLKWDYLVPGQVKR